MKVLHAPAARWAAVLASAMLLSTSLPWFMGRARAATATTTFNVTANVVDACAVTANDLAFGTYDPASATDKVGTSTLNVNCSLGTAYTLSLNNGTYAQGATRRLASGSNRLNYQLYKDAAHATIFGAVADALGTTGIGTGAAVPSVIYGLIPKAQAAYTGSYSDQITVTVDY